MELPHITRYDNETQGGTAKMFYVKINEKYKEDAGLHAHEYEHVTQWYIMTALAIVLLLVIASVTMISAAWLFVAPFVHNVAYKLIPQYRQYCEVAAFKEQLLHRPDLLDFCADRLATQYGLKLTKEEAIALLD